jgi:hypothetical protein
MRRHGHQPVKVATAFRRIGILTNPGSGGNRQNGSRFTAVRAKHLPAAHHHNARTEEEIHKALGDFQRAGVDLVVINGGDGTVQAVLSYLYAPSLPPSWQPTLALLRAGTASMLARDVGLAGSQVTALERLAQACRSNQQGRARILDRHLLRVERTPEKPVQCGMFFGCGAVCRGIDLCHGRLNRSGIRGELMPGLILLHQLLDLARGRHDRLGAVYAGGMADSLPLPQASYLLIVASTLERLILGFHPFWGLQDQPLKITAIETRTPHLLRQAWRIFCGRAGKSMTPEYGYHSISGKRIRLDFAGDFTLDGELFSTDSGLTITPAGPARFLVL